jgi:hypothetical protein
VWPSEFTTKAATLQGAHLHSHPTYMYVGFGPIVVRARVWFTRYLAVVPRPLFVRSLCVSGT